MNNNPFAAWANQLLEYQRQYQNAWQALSANTPGQQSGGAGSANSNPWVAALEQWWRTAQPGAAEPVQDFYAKLVEQGKAYFQVTDGLNKAFQQAAAAGESMAHWQDAMSNSLAGLKDMFGGHKPDMQGPARQAVAFWELPLNTWQRAVSSSSILPGDFLQDVSGPGVGRMRDEMHGRVDQLLSTPAIGYMRAHQEQTQILGKLQLDYQQALQDYAATYGEIGVKCVEGLQQAVQQRMAAEEPLQSLREIYDLWVDSCEEAYGEYVKTDKYVEIYGHLVNSLMALKRHGAMMVDEVLGAMNMPTRVEIDTLHRRLQETRREGKALRSEVESLGKQLNAEIGSAKKEVRANGSGQAQPTSANASNAKSKRGANKKAAAPRAARASPQGQDKLARQTETRQRQSVVSPDGRRHP